MMSVVGFCGLACPKAHIVVPAKKSRKRRNTSSGRVIEGGRLSGPRLSDAGVILTHQSTI